MIKPLSIAVGKDLKLRGFPYDVTYGPERTQRTGPAKQGIVFARLRGVPEPVLAPKGANGINPEAPYNHKMAGEFTVYARSQRPGATTEEHEDECDRVSDGVISAMRRILVERKLPLDVTQIRLLAAHEFNDNETWSGCAAEVSFFVTVLVRDVTYTDRARGEGTVQHVNKPLIKSAGFPDFDPEAE